MNTNQNLVIWMGIYLSILSCTGDVKSVYPESAGEYQSYFIEAGGTEGAAVAGRLVICTIDEITGEKIEGANIALDGTTFSAVGFQTDASGCTVMHWTDAVNKGPVHIYAPGYVLETLVGLKAETVTVPLVLVDPPGEKTIVLEGIFTGGGNLQEPMDNQKRVSVCSYGSPLSKSISKESIHRPFLDLQDHVFYLDEIEEFRMVVPRQNGIVSCFAGLETDPESVGSSGDMYEFSHMGFAEVPVAGGEVEGNNLEIDLDIQLDSFVTFSSFGRPGLYDVSQAKLGLDFGDMGVLWFKSTLLDSWTMGASIPEDLEALDGVPIMSADAGQQVVEDSTDEAIYPAGFSMERDVDMEPDTDSDTSPTAGRIGTFYGDLLAPPQNLGWDKDGFSCLPVLGMDMGAVWVTDGDTGEPHWRITVLGNIPGMIPVPVVPESWDWKGLPETGVSVRVWAVRFSEDVDANNMRFGEFYDKVNHFVENGGQF